MDRSFDSRPDERVKFEPDAWQREVLDKLDRDDSVLVVAPTRYAPFFPLLERLGLTTVQCGQNIYLVLRDEAGAHIV
jgi:hypothetical protein